jgi:K+-transporting ATPase ATPase B chain
MEATFERKSIMMEAVKDSFRKLDPRIQLKNPVMFVTEIGALLSSIFVLRAWAAGHGASFEAQIAVWLWFTVVFANFAEAMAEGRGKAQAEALRKTRSATVARLL